MSPSNPLPTFASFAAAKEKLTEAGRLRIEIAALVTFALALAVMISGVSPEGVWMNRVSALFLAASLLVGVLIYALDEIMAMVRRGQADQAGG
jgi:uncharacterized ion transporter superfamily protein YfcC